MALSEFDIIRRFFRDGGPSFPRPGIELGIGDDAAAIRVPPHRLLVMSMDVLSADVHYPAAAPPELIAGRALAVNLSDLAAMAAEPFCFTMGLTLKSADPDYLARFAAGLAETARAFNCPLVGGDINRVRGGQSIPSENEKQNRQDDSDDRARDGDCIAAIAIQVQGLCEADKMLRRDGARPGDRLYVTGTLGDAAASLLHLGLPTHLGPGLSLVQDETKEAAAYCKQRYYAPQPRLDFARRIASLVDTDTDTAPPLASAAIDISDGIAGDAGHLARQSGLAARIDLDRLPLSPHVLGSLGDEWKARLLAACGGDDYELALTIPPRHCEEAEHLAAEMSLPFTCIGEMSEGRGVIFEGRSARQIQRSAFKDALQGFQHF